MIFVRLNPVWSTYQVLSQAFQNKREKSSHELGENTFKDRAFKKEEKEILMCQGHLKKRK